ncbi:hypothetical protein OKW76_03820 [Sphingomonas sp. S1-29]|uniref:hypothetical protein n=1 Tax=Sphingomonas sp. S1-29 TaxID=2991074 RepID=UPI00223EC6C0|nr:hypothetical protein [Sphingomonas sp. S1-29]UZK70191.1 hypothetical protein OKW76_03820 [Sphingomonas sp. S1-29]
MIRPLVPLFAAIALVLTGDALAQQQQGGFDLDGPALSITVTRDGVTLPITAVPSLRAGDRLSAKALLPDTKSARYLLIGTFLRGAANPPPKDWFEHAETWKSKGNVLELTVPEGAEQALILLAPQTGGGFDAVRDGVRGRPGVFVRAAKDLHQASLDQARLETFVATVGTIADTRPGKLATAAPLLAKALGIKLNAECLTRPRALQASCLTQNKETLVLQAQRGTTLAETLTGTPVDVAYRIAATPEAGAGYYSPYIGLARDVARLFGAFRTAQYQYLPALTVARGDDLQLKLNAPPSFQNPRSVLLAPLPPIGVATPPSWQPGSRTPICLARSDVAIPLDDASLLFATNYARDLAIAVTVGGKASEIPVLVDVAAGGVRPASLDALAALTGIEGGVLHGKWGFDRFSGPRLPLVLDAPDAWRAEPDDTIVVGREHGLTLKGGAAACVSQLTLRDSKGSERHPAWTATAADAIEAKLPLETVAPGAFTLTIARHGAAPMQRIALKGRVEASRLDRFVVHLGDREAVLRGSRLDQVAQLAIGEHRFAPGDVSRGEQGDRMTMRAETALIGLTPGKAVPATAILRDGRTLRVTATIAPPRPSATLISREAAYQPAQGVLPIALPDALLPEQGRLAFSFRVANGPLREGIELAAKDGSVARLDFASGALQRVGEDVIVASASADKLFDHDVSGPLRFRLLNGDAPGDWQPLAHIVRLPEITRLACAPGQAECALSGRSLFLIAAISETADFANSVAVPIGFVGASIALPRPAGDTLFLRLHDAPDAIVRLTLPKAP